MKAFKFFAVIIFSMIAVLASGMIDVSHLIDLPNWIKPEDGLLMAAVVVTPTSLNESARKFRKALITAVILGLEKSSRHMTVRPGITFEETVGELDGSFELKPYTGAYPAALSDATIKGRTLKTWRGQVYELFHLKNLISTIYGLDMTAKKKSDKFDLNAKILFKIVNQISGKLNLHLFDAVRDDAGDETVDLFNGFDTITSTEITATTISVALKNLHAITGPITSSNAVDILKAMYRAASDELKEESTKMVIPFATYDAYVDDYQATVGAVPYNKEFKKTFLEGSDNRCELVPLVGKKASSLIHLTTKSNMLIGTDQMSDMESVRVKEDNNVNYTQMIMEMFFGVQFETLHNSKLLVGQIS